ncbi:hypothetical protein [Haloarchaeobius sp. DFWS5]|uniref:hypothetical protein n=1 Tax=Haloarchaeobius sp. DFWS5 TaxID=3446114 RepID=UPI003EBED5D8
MVLRKALLVELFALLVVLYAGFAMLSPDKHLSPRILDYGFLIGLGGLVYGLVGDWITE